jgi:SpoVK/Ycf46/Vps4 family AAA+-type ATPase
MADSDAVKRMVESHQRGDEAGFRQAAESYLQHERRMKHHGVAEELERLLTNRGADRPLNVASLKALPQARDERSLLALRQPQATLRDMVLPKRTLIPIEGVIREFSQRQLLASRGVTPRSKVLFVGPPGCGKSMAAAAIAAELGLPLAQVQLAAVVSSYLGDTARNLDGILEFARSGTWVLLFDEFDMLAKERSDQTEHGELRRVVAALLQMLDDFEGDSMVIATSNHPGLLDEAVWRRFDDVVLFDFPTQTQISELLRVKFRGLRTEFNRREVARSLKGASPADVEMACLAAARAAILQGSDVVEAEHMGWGVRELHRRQGEVARFLNSRRSSANPRS